MESEEEDPLGWVELFSDDEELVAALVAENRERLLREMKQKEEKARKEKEIQRQSLVHQAVIDSIIEYDPKQNREVYTRFYYENFSSFDINEESPICPMRFTHRKYKKVRQLQLETAANIRVVKIVSSDLGFPINVYGTVIARDCIDYKCIYLFRRDRHDCQLINSKGKSLILTGPGRGLVLIDFIYLEIDLKVKGQDKLKDKQFSKGLVSIDGRVFKTDGKVELGTITHESWLSTVEVKYAAVQDAVEATIECRVLEGDFFGKITARCSREAVHVGVLHDSKADGAVVISNGSGIIRLRRSVMAVCVREMLEIEISNQTGDAATPSVATIEFAAFVNGTKRQEVICGAAKMQVRVTWSVMDSRP